MLGDDGLGGGEARDDGVARVELAVDCRLVDLRLVGDRLPRTQRAPPLHRRRRRRGGQRGGGGGELRPRHGGTAQEQPTTKDQISR